MIKELNKIYESSIMSSSGTNGPIKPIAPAQNPGNSTNPHRTPETDLDMGPEVSVSFTPEEIRAAYERAKAELDKLGDMISAIEADNSASMG